MTWVQYAQGIAAIVAVITPMVVIIGKLSRLCQTVDHFTKTIEKLDQRLQEHLEWHLDHAQEVLFPEQHEGKPIPRSIKPRPRPGWEDNPLSQS